MMNCYSQRYSTARENHECEFCEKTIEKGEKYSYEKGRWDGEFFTRKLCLLCEKMLEEYFGETGYDEFTWEEVSDYLVEEHCRKCVLKNDAVCNGIPERCEHVIKFYKEE